MFMEKSNGANLAPAKYMHVMYKCRVSLVGGGGGVAPNTCILK